MTKRLVLLSLGLLLGLSANAFAAMGYAGSETPDRVKQVDWGVGVSAAFNSSSDDTAFISTAVSYGITPYIAIGVETGWQEADGDSQDDTVGFVPILADLIFRVPTVHESIVPYGILGLGGTYAYVDNDHRGDDDDTSFSWKLGGGIDWFINTQWIFNFEFAYWDADVNLPRTSLGNDASFWTLGVGLKYLF